MKMLFRKEIQKIIKSRNAIKTCIFVDMDGVIADYRFGEGKNIKMNTPNTYAKKRPIKTTIEILSRINEIKNIELYILSSCLFKEQSLEKNEWLNKYAPYFKEEQRIFIIANDFNNRKQLKVDAIRNLIKRKSPDLTILIDDTHEILFLAQEQLGKNFLPFHIISLLD